MALAGDQPSWIPPPLKIVQSKVVVGYSETVVDVTWDSDCWLL